MKFFIKCFWKQLIFLVTHLVEIYSASFHLLPQTLQSCSRWVWLVEEAKEEAVFLPMCRAACTKGPPAVPCSGSLAGPPSQKCPPGPDAAGFSSDGNSDYSRKFSLALCTLIIQEVIKLGNAGQGSIYGKDLGRSCH